jgi:hypothetical protein
VLMTLTPRSSTCSAPCCADAVPDQRRSPAQPLIVPGLPRQVREQAAQVIVRRACVLPVVSVPTLVLRQRGDPWVRAESCGYLAEHIPGAVLAELDGDGHLPTAAAASQIMNGRRTTATISPAINTVIARRMAGGVPAEPSVVQGRCWDAGHRLSVPCCPWRVIRAGRHSGSGRPADVPLVQTWDRAGAPADELGGVTEHRPSRHVGFPAFGPAPVTLGPNQPAE